MTKFIHTIESYVESIEKIIENWFQKHFSHITPGTPDHAVVTSAKDDLKATLGVTTPASTPAPINAPAVEPAVTTEPTTETASVTTPQPETAA